LTRPATGASSCYSSALLLGGFAGTHYCAQSPYYNRPAPAWSLNSSASRT
jgi:hypothetical protein